MRQARILDTSALVLLMRGHPVLYDLLEQADSRQTAIGIPTVALAAAEAALSVGSGWQPILLTANVRTVPLDETAAIEIGSWPGELAVRQVVREARLIDATVVTGDPGAYRDLYVPLLVV